MRSLSGVTTKVSCYQTSMVVVFQLATEENATSYSARTLCYQILWRVRQNNVGQLFCMKCAGKYSHIISLIRPLDWGHLEMTPRIIQRVYHSPEEVEDQR